VINNYNNNSGNNFRNVNYANQRVSGAVMAVPQNSFASGASVQRAAVRITPDQIRSAPVIGAAPVAPQRASVLAIGNNAGRPFARPPVNIAARPVVAKLAPPPAAVRFEAQQQALQQNPGRPIAPQQLQSIRQSTPAAAAPRIPIRTVNPSQVHAFTPVPQANPQGNQPARPVANNPAPNTYGRPPASNPPAPAYARPESAPPAVVNRPAPPPPGTAQRQASPPPEQQHPAAAPPKQAPKPAPKPKEEKPREEKKE